MEINAMDFFSTNSDKQNLGIHVKILALLSFSRQFYSKVGVACIVAEKEDSKKKSSGKPLWPPDPTELWI